MRYMPRLLFMNTNRKMNDFFPLHKVTKIAPINGRARITIHLLIYCIGGHYGDLRTVVGIVYCLATFIDCTAVTRNVIIFNCFQGNLSQ